MNKLDSLLLASALVFPFLALANQDGGSGRCERHGTDMFSEADSNKDGYIDKAEDHVMHEKRFNEMDTNHDGKLSADEVKAYKNSHNAMHDKGSMGFKKADKDNDGTVDRDEVHNYMKDHKGQ